MKQQPLNNAIVPRAIAPYVQQELNAINQPHTAEKFKDAYGTHILFTAKNENFNFSDPCFIKAVKSRLLILNCIGEVVKGGVRG